MAPVAYAKIVTALLRTPHDARTVVRIARSARGWTQAELGRRCGYSPSQVSRWENGKLPLRDVALLRTLADVLLLPPAVFGLDGGAGRASRMPEEAGTSVSPATTPGAEEDDPVRRRAFLQLAAVSGTLAWTPEAHAAGAADPARVLADRLGDVLLGPPRAGFRASPPDVARGVTQGRREFAACRYLPLADRLPALISAAESCAAERHEPVSHRMLAETYVLAARALIKLESSGLEWLAADRALRAAYRAEQPLVLAEAQRLVASVARRAGHHERALALTVDAADHLEIGGRQASVQAAELYVTLYLSAAYAAARAGDRARSRELLSEAEAVAPRVADDPARHRAVTSNLVSHRVSAAYELGDAGEALSYARSLPLAAIPTTERRARLLVDTAQAWARWDKPDRAYRTLLTAERAAPGEVRTRNAVRRLVTDLLDGPRHGAMPGLPALARRVHVPT